MFQITKITKQIFTAFCSKFSACNMKPFFNGKCRSRYKIFVYKQNYRLSPVVSSSPLYSLPLDFQCLYFHWNSSQVSQLYFNSVTSKVQSTAFPGCIIYFIFEGLWGWKDSSVIKCACCSSRGLEFRFQNPCEMAYIKIYFIFIYGYVWCDYVCVHVWVCMGARRGHGSPGARVACGCVLLDMGAGNWAPVLWENSSALHCWAILSALTVFT